MDREEDELEELEAADTDNAANRWYDYVPLVLIGVWALVLAAEVGTELTVGHVMSPRESREIGILFSASYGCGVAGWLLLFGLYFVVAARKRAAGLWAAGGLCLGFNLLLYVALLVRRPRRIVQAVTAAELEAVVPFGRDRWSRRPYMPLKDCFACNSCQVLINYGVSACESCGERYRYDSGRPLPLEE